jgi:hypothetical protein
MIVQLINCKHRKIKCWGKFGYIKLIFKILPIKLNIRKQIWWNKNRNIYNYKIYSKANKINLLVLANKIKKEYMS